MWLGKTWIALLLIGAMVTPTVFAQDLTPVGLWKTVDDNTGEAEALVRIWIENGQLFGKIEKLFLKPGEDPNPKCEECPGDKKGQPLEGMTIMWGLTQDGEVWTGGYILDPDDGKTYKCKVRVEESGKTLAVRGFIGFSLLGRTQTWIRVE